VRISLASYGPGFIAHLIVSKCGDSIPLYCLEKQYRRLGIPISRSTMTDLFHRHAELLAPLPARLDARNYLYRALDTYYGSREKNPAVMRALKQMRTE